MSANKLKYIVSVIVFITALYIYIITLAPTVWFIDSGELSAVASTLGIAHPTGYPLFTIIGHLFTLLPISSSQVYNLNVMSAFFCSLGAVIFFLFLSNLFTLKGNIKLPVKTKKPVKKDDKHNTEGQSADFAAVIIIPAVSALLMAFSKTFWATANSVEVYPLHVFFIILLSLIFLKAISETNSNEKGISFFQSSKYYLMFALVLGLSFTNHMTTILLAPACLTLFLYKNLYDRQRMWKLLFWMAVCFIIGFSVYIYLPVRANMNPDFLWGNPYNLERFRWHITGKQFSVWIFSAQGSVPLFLLLITAATGLSVYGLVKKKTLNPNIHFIYFIVICVIGSILLLSSNEIVTNQFNKFIKSLPGEFGTGLIILALPGAYFLSRTNTTVFYFTVLTFFGCVFYSVNYDIYDIYSYFLLAYVSIAIWLGFSLLFIYKSLRLSGMNKIVFSAAAALLVILPVYTNYSENDESKNYYVEELTMNVFNNAEPNSIIISSQWDFWVSASWYYNYVKGIRKDLVIIDRELLRRSWYYIFLKRHYPEIYENSSAEIEHFLTYLDKFEHGIPYDQAGIMKAFEDMETSFVTKNPSRTVYTTWEIEQNKQEYFARDYIRIPDGLLFRLVEIKKYNKDPMIDFKIREYQFSPVLKNDYYHESIRMTYAMMFTSTANFLLARNKNEEAKKYIYLALTAKPDFPQALDAKQKYRF